MLSYMKTLFKKKPTDESTLRPMKESDMEKGTSFIITYGHERREFYVQGDFFKYISRKNIDNYYHINRKSWSSDSGTTLTWESLVERDPMLLHVGEKLSMLTKLKNNFSSNNRNNKSRRKE